MNCQRELQLLSNLVGTFKQTCTYENGLLSMSIATLCVTVPLSLDIPNGNYQIRNTSHVSYDSTDDNNFSILTVGDTIHILDPIVF